MHEQSKAAKRRFGQGKFHSHYFVGDGIDIGAGQDCLANYRHVFRGIQSCRNWDLEDGDAQFLATVADNTYDFVTSSHCLEHMVDVNVSLKNWIRVLKPGGYLVITIPDEEMYEHSQWPSRYNGDHKWSFTTKGISSMPKSINAIDLMRSVSDVATLEKLEVINEFFYPELPPEIDQTMMPNPECAIEFILRKNP